jgi:surface antigen
LREGISRGIRVQIAANGQRKVGVFIRSTGSGLPASKRSLVRAWDKEAGWRHPVFGTDEWVQQKGRPYFGSVIAKREQEIAEGVRRALEEAARSL